MVDSGDASTEPLRVSPVPASTPIAERYAASSMRVHRTDDGRAAMRCALGDAAALCDAISRDIAAENRSRGGKGAVTKLGLQLAAVADRCGDAIWGMRDLITFMGWREQRSAQGIEAQRAETGTGSVHEIPTPRGDAPKGGDHD